jgi:chemotaxis family two-component system sensor kinase Cph1
LRTAVTNDQAVDISNCDKEPIHIPGSIQPHGLMLVVDRTTGVVTHAAGDPAAWLGRSDWQGKKLHTLIAGEAADTALEIGRSDEQEAARRFVIPLDRKLLDAIAYRSNDHLVIEIEKAASDSAPLGLLPKLEAGASAFERAATMQQLWQVAAQEFRALTGFDRVMIYKFRDDGSGVVVAEDAASGQRSFLNHHFPASDIPKQARALYVRNLVRVIPDVSYRPQPLVPEWTEAEPLDMSVSVLRSVSPVHIQYLKNMDVAASASISIVKDGALWGLIACHHGAPRRPCS